jgi:hypothetical protein
MKKNTPQTNKDKSIVWLWFWTLLAVAAGVSGGVFLLLCHAPAAYQPKKLENRRQVSPYLTHRLGPDFLSGVQADQPFELQVEQAGLNDILGRYEWPQPLGQMSFGDPMVVFSGQAVFLMGTLEYGKVSSVVTVLALPSMNSDGKVCLNIQSIRMGMLPVTKLVSSLAQKAFEDNQSEFEGEPELEAMVRAMIHNEPFEPVFRISDRPFRITRLSIETGLIALLLEPVK